MMVYLKPRWITKILSNNLLIFGFLLFINYLMEMCAYIAASNFYSDVDRLTPCAYTGDLSDPEKASALFDKPIVLLGIFHVIAWLRVTVLCVVTCLGINIMATWYLTIPTTIFGIVAYIIAIMTYFSDDGETCATAQPFRAQYLVIEIYSCWAFLLFNLLPFLIVCMSKEKHDENIRKKDDDSDDEEEEEEDEKDKDQDKDTDKK